MKPGGLQEVVGVQLRDEALNVITEQKGSVFAHIGCLQIPQAIGPIHEGNEEKGLGLDKDDRRANPRWIPDPNQLPPLDLSWKGLEGARLGIVLPSLLRCHHHPSIASMVSLAIAIPAGLLPQRA